MACDTEHHDSSPPHKVSESEYLLALLPTQQEELDMEDLCRVLEGSHQQWSPPQGHAKQLVSQPQPAAQQQVRKVVLHQEQYLEEDRYSLASSMDLNEAAIRERQSRAEILDRVAARFNLDRATDTAPVKVIGLQTVYHFCKAFHQFGTTME